MLFLRRLPDADEREDGAGVVIGPVIDLDVVTHEGVKVEQANGDGWCGRPRSVLPW